MKGTDVSSKRNLIAALLNCNNEGPIHLKTFALCIYGPCIKATPNSKSPRSHSRLDTESLNVYA